MHTEEAYEIRASVETEEQLAAALSVERLSLIYIDEAAFSDAALFAAVERCHAAGKRAGLRLRRIALELSEQDAAQLVRLIEEGLDAVLVRAMEQLVFVEEISKNCKKSAKHFETVYDYTVYGYNGAAVDVLRSLGADCLTYPVELNYRELRQLRAEQTETMPYELLVYGHLPMMVSANCLRKTRSGCNRKNEILFLKDRRGKEMPVRCYCKFCYNQIFNADPLVLYDLKEELAALAPKVLRYDFSVESAEQLKRILDGSLEAKQLTRGHFKRGIE